MSRSKVTALFLVLQAIIFNSRAQTLFTYGNKPVSKAEFLKAYNKNNTEEKPTDKSYRDYLELYTRFKIKVQAALDARLDTLANQRSELLAFRSQVIESFMKDEASVQALMEEAMLRNRKDIHVAHIFIPVPASSTPQQVKDAETKINKAYAALQKGQEFGKVAANFSEDPSVKKNKGDIGYITTFVLPYTMETVVYTTPAGKFSKPLRSKIGYHIFKNAGERKALGRMRAAQILIALAPGVTEIQKQELKRKADSLYTVLQKGSDFKELAVVYSGDNITYQIGGEMPEFGVGRYDPAFEAAAFALAKDNDISKPVLTEFGYHIIKRLQRLPAVVDKSNKGAEEALRQQVLQSDRMEVAKKMLLKRIQQQIGFRFSSLDQNFLQAFTDSVLQNKSLPAFKAGMSLQSPLFTFAKQTTTLNDWKKYLEGLRDLQGMRAGKTTDDLMNQFIESTATNYYREHLEEYNKDFAYQLEEFREGNLLFEIMQRKIWDVASTDSAGLQQYYNAHKNNYWWESSADAILVTSSNDSIAENARKKLQTSYTTWRQLVDLSEGTIQADSGRFELNQIPVRERTNFTQGLMTAAVKNDADNSVTFAYIVKLYPNREPRSFADARGFVINDYQTFLEDKWVAELKKKYPVKVNQDVVKNLPKQNK